MSATTLPLDLGLPRPENHRRRRDVQKVVKTPRSENRNQYNPIKDRVGLALGCV